MIGMGGPSIGLREKLAVWRQLSSGQLAQGSRVKEFEKRFGEWVGSPHSIALNSGTSALHLGLLALGIGPGDEVIVPSFSFAASANAIALTGARPIFCDVEEDFFTLDVEHARSLVTGRTKAIMPVHLYGQLANMVAIQQLAQERNLFIVEDAAQAHGASLAGRPAGLWGDLAAFSFYPTKNMTAGEGGMVVTSSDSVVRMVKLLRNQGMEAKYHNEVVGFNNRMTELAAAIGIGQLARVDTFNRRRQKNAAQLIKRLSSVPGLILPKTRQDSLHVYHQFTVRIPNKRDQVLEKMHEDGVSAAVYYPTPIHRLPAYGELGLDLPVTEKHCREVLSLPIHPRLSRRDVEKVASALERALS